MYTPLTIEHFLHPRNAEPMQEPGGVGEAGNPRCGDVMRIYIRVAGGVITKASFQTMGCVAAIALSSCATELLPGKTVAQALALTDVDYANALGGLPPTKMRCSAMTQAAVAAAIYDYQARYTDT